MDDLVQTLFNSTTHYIGSQIQGDASRDVFTITMHLIHSQYESANEKDVTRRIFLAGLQKQRDEIQKTKCRGAGWFKYRYAVLAYDNAIDIITSLRKRFITGGHGEGVFFPRPKK